MKNILTIIGKEMLFLMKNPVGYVFAGLLLIVVNWMYFYDFFISGQADLLPFWSTMVFLFSIFIPAISMGLIADEKKNGNWEVLLSLPIDETQLVIGKFLGSVAYILITLLLSLPAIITVFSLGRMDAGVIVAQVLGVLIIGCAYLSTGLWFSSISNQPIIAFLLTAVTLILNNLIGQSSVVTRLPGLLQTIVEQISLSNRVSNFMSGLIRVNDLIFFLSWIAIFLIMTVISLKGRDK